MYEQCLTLSDKNEHKPTMTILAYYIFVCKKESGTPLR